jgi:hypothetical protein
LSTDKTKIGLMPIPIIGQSLHAGRTIRKVMGGGGPKKIFIPRKKLGKKNLSRHSAKKKFLAWKIGL